MSALISCITVSAPARWGLLQRAILDFAKQTYVDREMIIAVSDPKYAKRIQQFLRTKLPDEHIGVFFRSFADNALGTFNALIQACGELIAYWDDDNQNTPERLAVQAAAIGGDQQISAMGASLYYFYDTREVFFVNYEQASAPMSECCAVSSLLVNRDNMPVPQLYYRTHLLSQMVDDADRNNTWVGLLSDPDFMHMVGVRGDNKRTYEVHRRLATTLPMSYTKAQVLAAQEKLTAVLDKYCWDAGIVKVCGRDGDAFEYGPKKVWSPEMFPIGEPKDDVHRETVTV